MVKVEIILPRGQNADVGPTVEDIAGLIDAGHFRRTVVVVSAPDLESAQQTVTNIVDAELDGVTVTLTA